MDLQTQAEVICMEHRTCPNAVTDADDPGECPYDFAVIHCKTDESLGNKFFEVLEQGYQLKGFLSERDNTAGKLKQRFQVAAWKKSRFVVELISSESQSDKTFQRLRSIAHEVECKKGKDTYPELLPVFLDIPREEQRKYTTTVGRTYSDSQEFWDELISYMNGSSRSSESSGSEHDLESDISATNNNLSPEESAAVKYRRKHKVFHGLFSRNKKKKKQASTRASKRVRKSKKKNKRKSKKKRKFGIRKLFRCVPSKSDFSGAESSYSYGPPENTQTQPSEDTPSTARQDSVEGEYKKSAAREELRRA